jgi:beta-glucanase (GH16 family)
MGKRIITEGILRIKTLLAVTILVLPLAIAAKGRAQATQAPPQAAKAGDTRLDFFDDFNYPDLSFLAFKGAPGKIWSAALWYKPGAAAPQNFSVGDSSLTIRANTISTLQNSPPYTGRNWLGGYFEARMYCGSPGGGICFFYLGSLAWAQLSGKACGASYCAADKAAGAEMDSRFGGTSEIDIIEAYSSNPRMGQFTVHKSGSGAGQQGYGVPDEVNQDSHAVFGFPLQNAWHTYGLLWTKDTLYWYVDNKLAKTAPAYKSTWQPAFITLGVSPDRYDKHVDPAVQPQVKIDWVKVWQPAK